MHCNLSLCAPFVVFFLSYRFFVASRRLLHIRWPWIIINTNAAAPRKLVLCSNDDDVCMTVCVSRRLRRGNIRLTLAPHTHPHTHTGLAACLHASNSTEIASCSSVCWIGTVDFRPPKKNAQVSRAVFIKCTTTTNVAVTFGICPCEMLEFRDEYDCSKRVSFVCVFFYEADGLFFLKII